MHLIVASHNPVKLAAAQGGFAAVWPGQPITCRGVAVPSGVPDQPRGEDETRQGARNRATAARTAQPAADFWVGIEGGIACYGSNWFSFGWVTVLSQAQQGEARSASFLLPPAITRLLAQGLELGAADDRILGTQGNKRRGGTVGTLTQGVINRQQLYQPAVSLALIPFLQGELFA